MDKHDARQAIFAVTPIDIAEASLVAQPVIPSGTLSEAGNAATVTSSTDVEQQQALRTSVEAKYKVGQPENEATDLDHLPPDEKSAFSEKTPSDGKPQQHKRLRDIQDFGAHAQGKKRNRWYQLWRPKNGPPPAPSSLDDVPEIPLAKASLFSQLTYTWVTPLMTLGYQRPLMATDLWKMDKSREAGLLGERFMQAYTKRETAAKEYNAKLADPVQPVRPSRYQRLKWRAKLVRHPRRHGNPAELTLKRAASQSTRAERLRILEEEWRQGTGRRQASIAMSLNETLTGFWAGGLFKVMGDTAQLMAPLLTKALITFSREGRCVKGLQFTL